MISEWAAAVTAKTELHLKLLAVEHPLDVRIIEARRMGAGHTHDCEQQSSAIIRCFNYGERLCRCFIKYPIVVWYLLRLLGAATAHHDQAGKSGRDCPVRFLEHS